MIAHTNCQFVPIKQNSCCILDTVVTSENKRRSRALTHELCPQFTRKDDTYNSRSFKPCQLCICLDTGPDVADRVANPKLRG